MVVTDKQVIVCSGEQIESALKADSPLSISFSIKDGYVYNSAGINKHYKSIEGTIRTSNVPGNDISSVEIIISHDDHARITGRVRGEHGWTECEVRVLPIKKELFSRFKGLLETDYVSGKTVLVVAVGSVGSAIVKKLVQSGVDRIIVVDYDRIGIEIVMRHEATLDDVGRFKTDWAKDFILSKNPYAEVEVLNLEICAETADKILDALKRCDLAICTIDNQKGKLFFNHLAVKAGVTCLYAGAFTRAYGTQVLRVIPGKTPCYHCFVKILPDRARDEEISDLEQARAMCIQYADRPAPIQAGLAIDIEPASFMASKLALQELLKGKSTPLDSVTEDLTAHWYFWLNRREPNTEYEHLEPLDCYVDGIRILRWIGVDFKRNENCHCCGNGFEKLVENFGIKLPVTDVSGSYQT